MEVISRTAPQQVYREADGQNDLGSSVMKVEQEKRFSLADSTSQGDLNSIPLCFNFLLR